MLRGGTRGLPTVSHRMWETKIKARRIRLYFIYRKCPNGFHDLTICHICRTKVIPLCFIKENYFTEARFTRFIVMKFIFMYVLVICMLIVECSYIYFFMKNIFVGEMLK